MSPGGGWRALPRAVVEELSALVRGAPADSELAPQPQATLARSTGPWRFDLALVLTLFFTAVYAWFGFQLTQGRYLLEYNLAYDLDPWRWVLLLGGERSDWTEETFGPDVQIKHPFVLLFRPLVRVGALLGLEPALAATLAVASAGGATVGLAFLYARALGIGAVEAFLASLFFGCTAAQMILSSIAESYALAACSLAAMYLVALVRLSRGAGLARTRFGLAALVFAVTSSNVAMACLAEAGVWLQRLKPSRAVVRSLSFGIVLAGVLGLAVIAWYPAARAKVGLAPTDAVRAVHWTGNLEEVAAKRSIFEELLTFAGFSFVAPVHDTLSIEEGTKEMLDLRRPEFTPLGRVGFPLWMAFLMAGLAAGFLQRERRVLLLTLLGCLFFNVALHRQFQFRGSLFLVSGHAQFAVWAIALLGIERMARGPRATRQALRVFLAAAALLAFTDHRARLLELIQLHAL